MHTFFDVAISGRIAGRIVFEVCGEPRAVCELWVALRPPLGAKSGKANPFARRLRGWRGDALFF